MKESNFKKNIYAIVIRDFLQNENPSYIIIYKDLN